MALDFTVVQSEFVCCEWRNLFKWFFDCLRKDDLTIGSIRHSESLVFHWSKNIFEQKHYKDHSKIFFLGWSRFVDRRIGRKFWLVVKL